LVEAAAKANFVTLLTGDRLFGESAAGELKNYTEFCVVRVTLVQARAPQFLSAFRSAWQKEAILPVAGRIVDWPST
jgi:hypothetical protein